MTLDVVLLAIVAVLGAFLVVSYFSTLRERTTHRIARDAWDKGTERLNERLARANDRADTATANRDELAASNARMEQRLEEVTPAPLTAEDFEALKAKTCVHCGGIHDISCPRVKRLRFRADGATPVEVEFWSDWPQDRVTYLEDILPPAEEPVTAS